MNIEKKLKEIIAESKLNCYRMHELMKIYYHSRTIGHLKEIGNIASEFVSTVKLINKLVDIYSEAGIMHIEFNNMMEKIRQEE